jgi:hypothetical protein
MSKLDKEIAAFIDATPRGAEFEFAPDLTGIHGEHGDVWYNEKGITHYEFLSLNEFINFYFKREKTNACVRYHVGDIDDGVITWHKEAYPLEEIDVEEDDGSMVFTLGINTLV